MPPVADPGGRPVPGQLGVTVAEHLDGAGELGERPVPPRSSPPAFGDRIRERRSQPEHHFRRRVADTIGPVLVAQPEDIRQRLLDRIQGQQGKPQICPERAGDRRLARARRAGHHDERQAQRGAIAYGLGFLVSHCQNVRRRGPARKWPLPTLPVTSIRSWTGTSEPHGSRTWTWPLRMATSSASTTIPGLVTSPTYPLRTSMSSLSDGCVITASVKSSFTWPLVTFTSIRCGTTHRSTRCTCPLAQSMRATSLARGAVPGLATAPSAGRSATSRASSP